jgi:hypothetical protein
MGLKTMNMCYNSMYIFVYLVSTFNFNLSVEVGGQTTKINQGGGGFRPLSERMNLMNCLNNILPQMSDILPVMGPVVSKGFWTSLSDWIGANSFDHANKDTR